MKRIFVAVIFVVLFNLFLSVAHSGEKDPFKEGYKYFGGSMSVFETAPKSNPCFPLTYDVLEHIKSAKWKLQNEELKYRLDWEKTPSVKKTYVKKGKRKILKIIKIVDWVPKFKGKKCVAIINHHRQIEDLLLNYHTVSYSSKRIELIHINPEGWSEDDNVPIRQMTKNGVNSRFEVYKPGIAIVGLKTLLKDGVRKAVYVPYSRAIDTYMVRIDGYLYLKEQFDEAEKELDDLNILSQCSPGKKVTKVVPKNLAFKLALIEHIDPSRLKTSSVQDLVHEVLVVASANREIAFNYSVSHAGARGLFQFMPGTYSRILSLYPMAGLYRDFITGMEDHKNGAMASYLLFDADLCILKDLPISRWKKINDDQREKGRVLAASYNWGAKRVKNAIIKYGDGWTEHVPEETKSYLKILDEVEALKNK